jgi:hypothetical protein
MEPSMQRRVQLIYDTRTGVVLGRHEMLVEEGATLPDLQLELARIRGSVAALADVELAFLDVDDPDALERPLRVDVRARAIAPAWVLRAGAPRRELEGDGTDSVELEIAALDEHGAVDPGFEDEVRVTTTRGRLSERGGRVRLAEGLGRITLTTAAETVDRVLVAVSDPAGRAVPASLELEFM